MPENLHYFIKNQIELNFSYMSFIKDGGLFVPTNHDGFKLDDIVNIDLQLPNSPETHNVEGKIIWITPANSLYQIFPGVGVQFIGDNAKTIHDLIKSNLDNTQDTGGYAYGIGNTANV